MTLTAIHRRINCLGDRPGYPLARYHFAPRFGFAFRHDDLMGWSNGAVRRAILPVFSEFRESVEQLFGGARRMRLRRIAVFIEADNVHDPGIRYVFETLSEKWDPVYRRAYGRGLMNRAAIFRKQGILPVEVVSNTSGKNAADMALVIEAMNELHAHRVDAFCLVTGDSDFTWLAIAIRERGLPVLGFGAASTPDSLRAACTEFHVFEDPAQARVTKVAHGKRKGKMPLTVSDRREFVEFVQNLMHGTGRVTFSRINREACKRHPNFSPRRCGANSLKALAEFQVRPVTNQFGVITDYEAVSVERMTAATPSSADVSASVQR